MGKLSFKSFSILRIFNFLSVTSTPATTEQPSIQDLSTPTGEFNEPPSSSKSGYEPSPDLIAMVRELSFSGLDSEKPYHHLREFELVCSCCAIAGMSRDTLRWKLFLFSLVEEARQWYTRTVASTNGNWGEHRVEFCLKFFPESWLVAL